MEINRNIKLNEISYFMKDKYFDTINDADDIKKYINLDIKCVSKSNLNNKLKYTHEFMNNLLSKKMDYNNATILFINCDNEIQKRNSVDMAISFALLNKRVLLIVNNSIEINTGKQIDIRENIKNTSLNNLQILHNPFDFKIMNNFIEQLKKIYDVIIIDSLPGKQVDRNISFLKKVDYIALVVNSGETKINDFRKVYKTIQMAGEIFINLVINKKNGTLVYNIQKKALIKKVTTGNFDKKNYTIPNRRIKELKEIIENLEEKIDYNKRIQNRINKKNDSFKQKIIESNEKLKEIIETKAANNKEASKDNIKKITQELHDIQNQMNNKVLSNQEELEKLIEQKIFEIQENMQNKIKQKTEEINQKIQNTKEQIKEEYKQEIDETKQQIENTKEQIKKEYKQEIDETKQQIENTREQIKEEHKQRVEEINQEIQNTKEQIKEEYKQGIDETKQQIENIKEEIKAEYEQKIENIIQQMEFEKNEIKREFKEYVKKAESNKKKKKLKVNKRRFSLDEDITYESLERNAFCLLTIKDGIIEKKDLYKRKPIITTYLV